MKHRLITIISLLATFSANAQVDISFEDAVELMYDNNTALKAASEVVSTAEYQRRAARGMYLPTIDVSANYTLLQRDANIDLGGAKGIISESANSLIHSGIESGILTPDLAQLLVDGITPLTSIPWTYTLQNRSFGMASANITIPIYAGGRIRAANSAADIALQKSEYDYVALKNSLLSELVRCYYGVIVQQQVVVVRQEVVNGMVRHLADAIAMEEEGIVAHSTVLYVMYKHSEAERDLESAKMNLRVANCALQTLLGVDEPLNITGKLFLDNNIHNADYYIDNALQMNPILSATNLDKQLAEVGSSVARAGFLPEVALVGSGIVGSHQLSDIIPRWAVGVGVDLKLFDGLSSQNRYRAARIAEKAAENAVETVRDNIALLIEKEYYSLLESRHSIITSQRSIDFATSYLNTSLEGFQEGIIPSSELIDAQIELAAAKLEYIDAAYKYCLALAHLLEASGMSYNFVNIASNSQYINIE